MTTIVAVKANKGQEGIALVVDTQIIAIDKDESKQKDKPLSKVLIGKTWALAYAGVFDTRELNYMFDYLVGKNDFSKYTYVRNSGDHVRKSSHPPSIQDLAGVVPKKVREYLEKMKGKEDPKNDGSAFFQMLKNKGYNTNNTLDQFVAEYLSALSEMKADPVEEARRTKRFYALELFNKRFPEFAEDVEFEEDEALEFIVAYSNPVELYSVDSRGNMHPVEKNSGLEYKALGSGSDAVDAYVEKITAGSETKDPYFDKEVDIDQLTLRNAARFAVSLGEEAAKIDANTNDKLDPVIVMENKIISLGEYIKTEMKTHKKDVYELAFDKIGPRED